MCKVNQAQFFLSTSPCRTLQRKEKNSSFFFPVTHLASRALQKPLVYKNIIPFVQLSTRRIMVTGWIRQAQLSAGLSRNVWQYLQLNRNERVNKSLTALDLLLLKKKIHEYPCIFFLKFNNSFILKPVTFISTPENTNLTLRHIYTFLFSLIII